MTSRLIPFIALLSLAGCNQSEAAPSFRSNNTNNGNNNSIFSPLLDSDSDQIPDIYDDFPLDPNEFIDSNFNGSGDNQDSTDAAHHATAEDLQTLSERLLSFQTGLGSLATEHSNTQVSEQAKKLESRLIKYINHSKAKYDDGNTYNLSFDEQGNLISGTSLTKQTFGAAVTDLYYLALASHRDSGDEAKQSEQKAMNLIKWLQWNGVSHEDLSLVDSWYLSVLGQGVLLLKDKLSSYGLDDYLLSLMWQSDVGKTGINELIHFDYSSVDYRDQTYFSADLYRSEIFFHFAGVSLLPEETDNQIRFKIAKLEQFKTYLIKALHPSPGLHPFLKPDGSAFHHYTNYMSGYVPQAAYALTRLAYMLHGSPWALSTEELDHLSNYVTNYYFYTSLNSLPVGGRGRLTSLSMPSKVSNMLYLLASMRSNDLNLQQTAINYQEKGYKNDYNPTYRLSQSDFPGELKALELLVEKINSGASPHTLTGARYYPYSSLFATRQDNWQATIKGLDRWTWSYEGGKTATNPQNLYGMYESYGSLQLHYFDKTNPSNGLVTNPIDLNNGYQWSHISGTTAPYRQLDEMLEDDIKSRYRLKPTSTGGTALTDQANRTHGLYMLELAGFSEQARDIHFTAHKSYFQIGDKIIALGSSINNQPTDILGKTKDYPIHTTLFHTASGTDATSAPIYIDSDNAITTAEHSVSFTEGNPLILVDNEKTGYFLPNNSGVTIERGHFSSRAADALNDEQTNIGHRNVAWIDHGKSPSNAQYEYVVLPNHDHAAVATFAKRYRSGKEYSVKAQDQHQHIVYDKTESLWAYALFSTENYNPQGPLLFVELTDAKPNEKGEILSSDDALVAMIKNKKDTMNLAIAYPDLRLFDGTITGYSPDGHNSYSAPVVITVKIKGKWKLAKAIEGVTLKRLGRNTQVSLELVDGLTREVTLSK